MGGGRGRPGRTDEALTWPWARREKGEKGRASVGPCSKTRVTAAGAEGSVSPGRPEEPLSTRGRVTAFKGGQSLASFDIPLFGILGGSPAKPAWGRERKLGPLGAGLTASLRAGGDAHTSSTPCEFGKRVSGTRRVTVAIRVSSTGEGLL